MCMQRNEASRTDVYSTEQLHRSQAMSGWNRDVLQAILKTQGACTVQEAEQAIQQFMTREAN